MELCALVDWMAAAMACAFKTFLTVFQSYQHNEWVIIKGCALVDWMVAAMARVLRPF